MMRALKLFAAAALMAGSVIAGPPARAAACAAPAAELGEWRSYGQDLSNSRHQPLETAIGPGTVGGLRADRIFSADEATPTGGGIFQSTPIVADGCVYLGSDAGWVYALNADTLELVWSTKVPAPSSGLGGTIVGSVAVHGNYVLVPVSRRHNPYVGVLDRTSGALVREVVVEQQPGAFINASAVVHDDLVFMGFAGNEADPKARGGYSIVELRPGATQFTVINKTYTIPDADFADGYAGASVWTTAAVDTETGFVYAGGGNPASKQIEHRHTNALYKIDMRRGSPDFGKILYVYKGNVDQYYPGLDRQPACALLGDHPQLQILGVWSATCLQLDLDFGASPNLYRNSRGEKLLGALQKSGVFHTVYADNMQYAWSSVIAPPCFACNASSSATSGDSIYAIGTPPGQVVSLSRDTGSYRWASPVADVVHFQPVASANGVVYTFDLLGFLDAYDAASGAPLLRRQVGLDVDENVGGLSSAGVAVARGTVYAAAAGFVVAYRL